MPKLIPTAAAIVACVVAASAAAAAQMHAMPGQVPYAGQQDRAIKSLSAEDVDALLQGRGWGLAKAAELNGLPGPVHLLELKKEIGLTPEQAGKMQSLFDTMQAAAKTLGRQLVALERRLDRAFAERNIDEQALRRELAAIADVRARLRFVHLAAHLKTPALLRADQISQYNRLRGYGDGQQHGGHGGK